MADLKSLIEVVRQYPCLWHIKSKCYKDARVKENTWSEVVTRVDAEVAAEQDSRILVDKFRYHLYTVS